MLNSGLIYGLSAILCAALLTFTLTPVIRVFAFKIGAIDIPEDGRRMHTKPIPRIGGLAIFLGFVITTLAFCEITPTLYAIWIGGAVLVTLGLLDDVFRLNAWFKLAVQIFAAFIAVWMGLDIKYFNFFGIYVTFGMWSIPLTILWIVSLTNAVNFIDGLDGLACGVSAICALSLTGVTLIMGNPTFSVMTAIVAGTCLGFMPFNSNPAKIFMGDTGALFLGYTLSVLSVEGVFKTHIMFSFIIPLSIFGLPLFDTIFAVLRRLMNGKSPFSPDRGHLHHRLIDMGFGQKQSVRILYAISAILGIAALMFAGEENKQCLIIFIAALVIFIINFIILKNSKTREQSGIENTDIASVRQNNDIIKEPLPNVKTEEYMNELQSSQQNTDTSGNDVA